MCSIFSLTPELNRRVEATVHGRALYLDRRRTTKNRRAIPDPRPFLPYPSESTTLYSTSDDDTTTTFSRIYQLAGRDGPVMTLFLPFGRPFRHGVRLIFFHCRSPPHPNLLIFGRCCCTLCCHLLTCAGDRRTWTTASRRFRPQQGMGLFSGAWSAIGPSVAFLSSLPAVLSRCFNQTRLPWPALF